MKYFKLFPNCKIVLGKTNALIMDLERSKSELIPLDFASLLLELDKMQSLEQIKKDYSDDYEVILENLRYFEQKEYGIFCSKDLFLCFPEMSTDFQEPSHISNAVIELKSDYINMLSEYFVQLDELSCFNISLVLYEELSVDNYIKIFSQLKKDRIRSIEILSKWHPAIDNLLLKKISQQCDQLVRLSFFSAPYEKVEFEDIEQNILFERVFISYNITNFNQCGKITIDDFTTNISKVLEAGKYNSCLHKKIAIDIDGYIKNCPAMTNQFGNMKQNILKEAIDNLEFKKYWNLSKDKIEVCRDCEFRYVCTDCRAFTERTKINEEGLDISKPLKCGYDPYKGVWQDWSSNPLKYEAIKFYGFQSNIN